MLSGALSSPIQQLYRALSSSHSFVKIPSTRFVQVPSSKNPTLDFENFFKRINPGVSSHLISSLRDASSVRYSVRHFGIPSPLAVALSYRLLHPRWVFFLSRRSPRSIPQSYFRRVWPPPFRTVFNHMSEARLLGFSQQSVPAIPCKQ